MAIKLIEGKVLCSVCSKLLEKEESFKLNEFQYEIVCLDCDKATNFSKNNYVNCNTPMKQNLLNIIQKAMKNNKTISMNINDARRRLLDALSRKIKAISKN